VTIENAIGGSARDLIWGNSSANKLEGRGGNDTFAFSVVDKLSKIMDWNAGDKIDLTKIDAITGGADNAFSWIGATSSPRWRASSVTRTACSRVT
jgi:serralysin